MKTIRLLAFRNMDFRNPIYAHEAGLIRVGHVGLQLAGDPAIYGFHPTPDAIEAIGGDEAAYVWLRARHMLDGAVFDDTFLFHRAHQLASLHQTTTHVYVLEYQFTDAESDTIQAQLREWHNTDVVFPYAWPERGGKPMPPDRDNCATFPRRLGVMIPESTGRIWYYVSAMIAQYDASEWEPEE